MKRKLLVFLSLTILVIAFTNKVDAASDKKAVQSTVKSFFTALKKYDINGIAKLMQPKENRDSFVAFNEEPEIGKIVKRMHKDYLKYKIQKTTIKGNESTVKTKVTFYNAHGLASIHIVLNLALAETFDMGDVGKTMYEEYSRMTKKNRKSHVVTKTISIPLIKQNGKWVIKTPTSEIKHVIDCGIADSLGFILE